MLKVLLLSLIGCSDYMVHKEVVEEGTPDIVVVPERIDFGHLVSGMEAGAEKLTIINAGDIDLFVSDVVLGDLNGFAVTESGMDSLPPGESITIDISYVPETYEQRETSIIITSDDPDEEVIIVPVTGFGDAPVISVTPAEKQFEDVEVGCTEEVELEITNLGNLDLEIDSFSHFASTPVDTELKNQNSMPLLIAPGGIAHVSVDYAPNDLILDESQVIIDSNDPLTPELIVHQEGNGVIAETVEETFMQEGSGKVDIIFVVDNSGSMQWFQSQVASNINVFMSVFVTLSVDYQIGVITTDDPDFIGPIVTPTTTDPEGELANQIGTVAGIYGSGIERGIDEAYDATQPGADAGPGGTFLREDAGLVLVFVSDEPDYSYITWTDLANYLNILKGDPSKIIVHSVIGDYPSGCTYTNGPATKHVEYGAGYYDITKYYNGIAYSICSSNWGQQMQSMAQNSVMSSEYILSREGVIEDSIEVSVDGMVNTDWYYDSSTNAVAFQQSGIPEEGEEIVITYSLYGCIEEDQDTASN